MNWKKLIGYAIGILTIIASTIGIYNHFFISDKPQIRFGIFPVTTIPEKNQNLEIPNKLEIYYAGKEILKTEKRIEIFRLRIENIGDKDIIENLYDSGLDWGVEFIDCEILDFSFLYANIESINNSSVKQIGNKLIFPKIVMDTGAFFDIHIVLIRDKNVSSHISGHMKMLGKIAGMKNPIIEPVVFISNDELIMQRITFAEMIILVILLIVVFFYFIRYSRKSSIRDKELEKSHRKFMDDMEKIKNNYQKMADPLQ